MNDLLKQIPTAVKNIQRLIVRDDNDMHDVINRGGCPRFAIRAHRALNKLGIENKMLVCLHNGTIETNTQAIKNLRRLSDDERDNLSFIHCWVYIPAIKLHFDGKKSMYGGEFDTFGNEQDLYHREGDRANGSYTESQMITVTRVGWWNHSYDPYLHNKRLSKYIYNNLKLS